MQLIRNRLERIDIYSPVSKPDGYIGTTVKPELLGYVYADIQPVSEELSEERNGKTEKKSVKLILRPDAGVKCGDLAAIYSKSPNFEIKEIKRFSSHISVTAVTL